MNADNYQESELGRCDECQNSDIDTECSAPYCKAFEQKYCEMCKSNDCKGHSTEEIVEWIFPGSKFIRL